jgi:hypothetical protein
LAGAIVLQRKLSLLVRGRSLRVRLRHPVKRPQRLRHILHTESMCARKGTSYALRPAWCMGCDEELTSRSRADQNNAADVLAQRTRKDSRYIACVRLVHASEGFCHNLKSSALGKACDTPLHQHSDTVDTTVTKRTEISVINCYSYGTTAPSGNPSASTNGILLAASGRAES